MRFGQEVHAAALQSHEASSDGGAENGEELAQGCLLGDSMSPIVPAPGMVAFRPPPPFEPRGTEGQ
jgi:hypothetical protein